MPFFTVQWQTRLTPKGEQFHGELDVWAEDVADAVTKTTHEINRRLGLNYPVLFNTMTVKHTNEG